MLPIPAGFEPSRGSRRGAPPDAVHILKHSLVRDVVCASLPKAPRQQLHRSIAEAISKEFPERAEIDPQCRRFPFCASRDEASRRRLVEQGRRFLPETIGLCRSRRPFSRMRWKVPLTLMLRKYNGCSGCVCRSSMATP
jgi:hypothetical protein